MEHRENNVSVIGQGRRSVWYKWEDEETDTLLAPGLHQLKNL